MSNLIVNINNLEKIENFLSDSAYKEIIENSETFNTRLCIERRLRMPFLDPQTGVAQKHCELFMKSSQRIPGLRDGQIYSYPAARWRKSRRQYLLQKPYPAFPAYHHHPFGHFQSSSSAFDPDAINMEHSHSLSHTPLSVMDNDSKDSHKEESPKEWYYDEVDMHEMDAYEEPDPPDSDGDYEEPKHYRRKNSARGRGSTPGGSSSRGRGSTASSEHPSTPRRGRGAGRGRGRKSQIAPPEIPGFPIEKGYDSPSHTPGPKRGRPSALPQLTPHTSSSPLNIPQEEPQMPILVPELKVPEDIEEKLSYKAGTSHSVASIIPATIIEKGKAIPSPYCDFCLGDARENKKTMEPEELVSCSDCGRSGHPTCLQFTANMIVSVRKYRWQCIECKYCTICGTSDNDDQLLFCDDCDRGYHMYCLAPPLTNPPEGSWSCKLCNEEFHGKK